MLSAVFNAELAPAAVTANDVRLLGPQGNVIASTVSASGATLQVQPDAALPGDTTYTLSLDATIADTAGRTLGTAARASFTTAAQAWSTTATALGDQVASTADTYPVIAALADGGAMVAWRGGQLRNEPVSVSRYEPVNGTWSTPFVIFTAADPNDHLTSISLVPCANGDVLLLICTGLLPGFVTLYRHAAGNATWGAPATVQVRPAGSPGTYTRAVSDSRGVVTIIASDGSTLYATRQDAAMGAWSAPRRIDRLSASPYLLAPRLALDGSDGVVAAWIQASDDSSRAVWVARFDPAAGAWGEATSPGPGAMQYMDLAVSATGETTVAWATGQSLSAYPSVWSSRWTPQQPQWTAPVRLDADTLSGAGAPSLAVDGAGAVIAAWGQQSVSWARFDPAGGGWSVAAAVPASGWFSGSIALVADVAGNAVLSWLDPSNNAAAARFSMDTGQWQALAILSPPTGMSSVFANAPVAAIDAAGDVTLAWYAWNRQGANDRYIVSANRLQ